MEREGEATYVNSYFEQELRETQAYVWRGGEATYVWREVIASQKHMLIAQKTHDDVT
jgi:hypothetical protein